ncbi:glycosyl hydrolase family 28-related protein [Rahnella inusitata]|uniref:tail fiber/spike domain-containing protein n=1 Tax=Rahnella inusitata TaxID=58169 RepID=UPI0039BEA0DB
MATTPTSNPIPSEAPQDLKFNAGKIDEFVTSSGWTYTDRFGVKRYTIEGMNYLAKQSMAAFGYITLDSFQAGASITLPNQVLRDTTTGEYYRWDGALPKTVPANSTPSSSGGVGTGKWLSVGDAQLRQELKTEGTPTLVDDSRVAVKLPYAGAVTRTQHDKNKESISIQDFGADPTGVTDSAAAIQAAIDYVSSLGGGVVYIPGTTSSSGRGYYKVGATLILKQNVNIQGDGYTSNIKASSSTIGSVLVIQSSSTTGIAGRFIRDISIEAGGNSYGITTDQQSTDTVAKYVYGFDISNIVVGSADIGISLQGFWHSTLNNVTTSTCRVGLYLLGASVSVNITGCHFRRDGAAIANTYGIIIQPRVYAWSSDQTNGERSEAIVISGETMCIGQEFGIYVFDCLDLQMSNLDLDYIRKVGVVVLNVNGGFNLRNSWIAADRLGTTQFVGVNLQALQVQQNKIISGINFNLYNASTLNNNIGVNMDSSLLGVATVSECTFVDGWAGVYVANNGSGINIDKNIFGNNLLYISNCANLKISNNSLAGLTEVSKPANTFNRYYANTGLPQTNGIVNVPVASNGTSGSYTLTNPGTSLNYHVIKLSSDIASSKDTVSISSATITIARPVGVATAISSPVEFRAY